MDSNRIRLIIKGDEADEGLRLSDLIDQLDAIKRVLIEVDKRLSGKKSASLYYRVVGLSMNSPATIEMEAVHKVPKGKGRSGRSRHESAVISRVSKDLQQVNRGRRPANSDVELLETYKLLVRPQKAHVTNVVLDAGSKSVELNRSLESKIDAILGPDQVEAGSIVGALEVINIHNQQNTFKIYPSVGPSSISCRFPSALLSKAVEGIGHFVRISGDLHYKSAEQFPHFMAVKKIEKLPAKPVDFTLSSLRGIAKGAIGKASSVDYVNQARDADW